MKDEED